MEITWFGHSCFRLRERGASVVTDPYPPELGNELARMTTSIITVSHADPNHCYCKGFRGSPYVIEGPGEYEVSGIFVTGVATYHDDQKGKERGKNTAYVIEIDGLLVGHLGDLGHVPTQDQIEQFSNVDVLLIPVGGRTTITGAQAAEITGEIDPRIVIPMHYQVPGLAASLESEKRFLREMGDESPTRVEESLRLRRTDLPEQTTVMVLTPQIG